MSFHRDEEEVEELPPTAPRPKVAATAAPFQSPIPIVPASVQAPNRALPAGADRPKLPSLTGIPTGPRRDDTFADNRLPARITALDSPTRSAGLRSTGRRTPSQAGSVLGRNAPPAAQSTRPPSALSNPPMPTMVSSTSKEFHVLEGSPGTEQMSTTPSVRPPPIVISSAGAGTRPPSVSGGSLLSMPPIKTRQVARPPSSASTVRPSTPKPATVTASSPVTPAQAPPIVVPSPLPPTSVAAPSTAGSVAARSSTKGRSHAGSASGRSSPKKSATGLSSVPASTAGGDKIITTTFTPLPKNTAPGDTVVALNNPALAEKLASEEAISTASVKRDGAKSPASTAPTLQKGSGLGTALAAAAAGATLGAAGAALLGGSSKPAAPESSAKPNTAKKASAPPSAPSAAKGSTSAAPPSAAPPTISSRPPPIQTGQLRPTPLPRAVHLESVGPGSVRAMHIEEGSVGGPRGFHVDDASERMVPLPPTVVVQPPTEISSPRSSRRGSVRMGNLGSARGPPESATGASLASRIRSYIAGSPLPRLPSIQSPKSNIPPDTVASSIPPLLPPTVADDGNVLPAPPPDPVVDPLDRLASIRIPYVPATAHRPPLEPIPPLPEFLRGEASEPKSMRDLPGYEDPGLDLNATWRPSPRGPGSTSDAQPRSSIGGEPGDIALTGHGLTDTNYENTRIHVQGGRLTFEVALPPSLMNELQHPQYFHAPESTWPHFESVRYSAITCDPDELRARGYILRQTPVYNSRHVINGRGSVGIATSDQGYSTYAWVGNGDVWENGYARADGPLDGGDRPRIELCICVTLYNERADAFVRTMDSIFRNIYFLATRRQRRKSAHNSLRTAFEGPQRTGSARTTGGKYTRMGPSGPEGQGWSFSESTRKGTAERGWFYPNSWLKIVLVIVLDGPADPRVLDNLEAMGLYQPSCLWETSDDGKPRVRKTVLGDEIRAHLFEHTISVPSPDWAAREQGEVRVPPPRIPVQAILCMKTRNMKKINSHRWFFSLCSILQPRSTILLDVGTRPFDNAFWHLWRPIYLDPDIAGTCGEIRTSLGRGSKDLGNPLVAAQNFEYKTSNILDKPLETVLGFVSVLPGAFSCYRFAALLNDPVTGHGPLSVYLAGEFGERQKNLSEMNMVYRPMVNDVEMAKAEARAKVNRQPDGLVTRNSYLAEDRILCWELVSKKGERNKLFYNRHAIAETDPVQELSELILQRRRWLNGSFFTSWHAVLCFGQLYRSRHHAGRQFLLHLQWLFNLLNLWLAWLQPANFFISFFYISDAFVQQINRKHGYEGGDTGNYPGIYVPVTFLTWLYVGVTGTVLVISLGNKPNGVASQWFFRLAAFFYAILVLWVMAATGYLIFVTSQEIRSRPGGWNWQNTFVDCNTSKLWIAALSTYGLWFLSACLVMQPAHNIFNIFAFANTNTFAWGTKGITEDTSSKDFRATRSDPREEDELPVSIPQLDRLEASYRSCMARITQQEFLNDKLERQLDRRLETGAAREARERERTLDYYSSFRTALVLVWVGSNVLLAYIVLSLEQGRDLWTGAIDRQPQSICEQRGSTYMNFILYSIAAIAAVKFFGLVCYLTVLENMY
ncbi:hypothetical protein OC842_004943 [Tilletia horrida]|uniref:chitin synthase n=1 Tax=Tilletia horrida TaxID=155126 RepID=A0AAN6JJ31_9BASI|nr:hypothetical protein OC842_004943 [Tilletia horrida]